MKTFSALHRAGYGETAFEREVLNEMSIANHSYMNPKGCPAGNYLWDFMQKYALTVIAPIGFVSDPSIHKRKGLHILKL